MEAQVAADDVGGVSAAVARGSDVVWARAFGWADRDRRIPAGVGSIYRTGSISKTVTAVVMMRAVERGYIDLDQPLSEIFPASARFPDATQGAPPPTVRQFASHTSGLVREPDWDIAASGPIEIWQERIVESIPLSRFQNAPGVEYSYSNIGYGTLGLAVARAAGQPFMEFVEEDVFKPLGMTSSTFIIGPELAPRLTARLREPRATATRIRSSRRASMPAAATRCPTAASTQPSATWPVSWGRCRGGLRPPSSPMRASRR